MIHFVKGNIFDSEAQALVNPVNTDGVMGKGLALQFKNRFPRNYEAYKKACWEERIRIGRHLVVSENMSLDKPPKLIINFATKTTWRSPSQYEYISDGLSELVRLMDLGEVSSIAMPALGVGNGGLKWLAVKELMVHYLKDVDAEIFIYDPMENIYE